MGVVSEEKCIASDSEMNRYLELSTLYRTMYPKDLIICAVTLVCTVVVSGTAQRREQRIAKLKSQYLYLVPIVGMAVAMLIICALGSILAFLLGVTVPLAGIYHCNIMEYYSDE